MGIKDNKLYITDFYFVVLLLAKRIIKFRIQSNQDTFRHIHIQYNIIGKFKKKY